MSDESSSSSSSSSHKRKADSSYDNDSDSNGSVVYTGSKQSEIDDLKAQLVRLQLTCDELKTQLEATKDKLSDREYALQNILDIVHGQRMY
jgi:hypothetical protein